MTAQEMSREDQKEIRVSMIAGFRARHGFPRVLGYAREEEGE